MPQGGNREATENRVKQDMFKLWATVYKEKDQNSTITDYFDVRFKFMSNLFYQ